MTHPSCYIRFLILNQHLLLISYYSAVYATILGENVKLKFHLGRLFAAEHLKMERFQNETNLGFENAVAFVV